MLIMDSGVALCDPLSSPAMFEEFIALFDTSMRTNRHRADATRMPTTI